MPAGAHVEGYLEASGMTPENIDRLSTRLA